MKLNAENQIWDPETAYRESRAGNLRLLIAILVIIVVGAAWISGILAHQKRTGEVALNASMTFEEADKLLRDSGYNPMGLSYRKTTRRITKGFSAWTMSLRKTESIPWPIRARSSGN